MGSLSGRPVVSVVVPCFNHGEFLPEAVASVCQLGRGDVEVIVVDDGSTDTRTGEVMEELAARGIRTIRQTNQGLAAARNAGIAATDAEYIFPLDADDRMRTEWLQRGVEILEKRPRVGVVYGDAQCFGARTARWRAESFEKLRLLKANFIHASALYRRVIWEQNGGYDGTMPVQGYEDWDFWLGALECGWDFEYLAQIVFDYRQREKSMITHAVPFLDQIEAFTARKHALLYRREYLEVAEEHRTFAWERRSIKATSRILGGLLGHRLKTKLQVPSAVNGSRNGPANR